MTTTAIQLALTERTLTELRAEAEKAGKEPAEYASELLVDLLDERRRYRDAIKEGVAAYRAGETVDEAAMDAWLGTWGDEDELEPPR